MTGPVTETKFLRDVLRIIVEYDLSFGEAEKLASFVQSERFTSTISSIIVAMSGGESASNGPIAHPRVSVKNMVPPPSKRVDYSADRLFEDVKRRKINKGSLLDIIKRTSDDIDRYLDDDLSMRETLRTAKKFLASDDWNLLVGIVNGNNELDPFLQGLMNR